MESDLKLNIAPLFRRWYTSGWRPCSKSCGKGYQIRQIVCRQRGRLGKYKNLPNHSCSGTKPAGALRQDCNKRACPTEWRQSGWSAVCIGGVALRMFINMYRLLTISLWNDLSTCTSPYSVIMKWFINIYLLLTVSLWNDLIYCRNKELIIFSKLFYKIKCKFLITWLHGGNVRR